VAVPTALRSWLVSIAQWINLIVEVTATLWLFSGCYSWWT